MIKMMKVSETMITKVQELYPNADRNTICMAIQIHNASAEGNIDVDNVLAIIDGLNEA